MRLLIIRHGDPDYSIDSLTEKGWREAELLSERLVKEDITAFYVSPLGRAKDTASLTLKRMNRTATECQWLREFAPKIHRPDSPEKNHITWDWLPEDWTEKEEFFRRDLWYTNDVLRASISPATGEQGVKAEYEWVTKNFDALLAAHGYVRDGLIYRAEKSNCDTIALFCHFGLECVLLSHLMNISPMVLWHHTFAAPTSVTTIYTEERREGKATFRVSSFADISHLYVAGEKPSFSGRFCETYNNMEERHD